jgi:hypothetical protein
MDRTTQLAAEIRALRALCDPAMTDRLRQNLMKSLDGHIFLDPEYQVVFESIRSLFQSGPISAARLALHLNNRGFPDIDMDRYFSAAGMNSEQRESTNKKHA